MKKTTVLATGLLLVLGGLAAAPRLIDYAVKSARSGPVHRIHLRSRPEFLTDTIALENAYSALSLDGLQPAGWKPLEDRRTKAPDGTPDQYLARNALHPNRGDITFVRDRDRSARHVVIELQDDRVECQVWLPK